MKISQFEVHKLSRPVQISQFVSHTCANCSVCISYLCKFLSLYLIFAQIYQFKCFKFLILRWNWDGISQFKSHKIQSSVNFLKVTISHLQYLSSNSWKISQTDKFLSLKLLKFLMFMFSKIRNSSKFLSLKPWKFLSLKCIKFLDLSKFLSLYLIFVQISQFVSHTCANFSVCISYLRKLLEISQF